MTRFSPHMTILALSGAALALAGCSGQKNQQSAANEPSAASTDWTAQNPTETAVPVNLPKTVMTNVPAASPSPTATGTAPAKKGY